MRYTIIESNKVLYEAGLRLSKEGHHVTTLPATASVSAITTTQPDIVIFESPVQGRVAEQLLKQGIRVLGASLWAHSITYIPEYQDNFLDAYGIKFIPGSDVHIDFIEGWFNGNAFIALTHWRCVCRVGVTTVTACIGEAIPCTNSTYKACLKPLEAPLRKLSYRGPVTVSYDKDVVLAIHAGIAPTIAAFVEGLKGSLHDFLQTLVLGTNHVKMDKTYVQVPVQVTVHELTTSTDIRKHLWPTDATAFVTAHGVSSRECFRRIFRTLYGDTWIEDTLS